jgi:putative endonuclease
MPFDVCFEDPIYLNRRSTGSMAQAAGRSSEEQVIRYYEGFGAQLVEKNWRSSAGEVDLILQQGDETIFVEVKSSRTHSSAAEHLQPAQMRRICASAEEYIGTLPTGSLTPMRIDLALVDRMGAIDIVENALMAA